MCSYGMCRSTQQDLSNDRRDVGSFLVGHNGTCSSSGTCSQQRHLQQQRHLHPAAAPAASSGSCSQQRHLQQQRHQALALQQGSRCVLCDSGRGAEAAASGLYSSLGGPEEGGSQRGNGALCSSNSSSNTGSMRPATRTSSGGTYERHRTESLLDGGEAWAQLIIDSYRFFEVAIGHLGAHCSWRATSVGCLLVCPCFTFSRTAFLPLLLFSSIFAFVCHLITVFPPSFPTVLVFFKRPLRFPSLSSWPLVLTCLPRFS